MKPTNELQGPERCERRPFIHPLAAARLFGLMRTLAGHGGFSLRYSPQVGFMVAGCLLRWPICAVEAMRVARQVAKVTFDPPPIFIVGHWRSGTTYLHHLMSLNPAFCFPTLLDVLRPFEFFPSPLAAISESMLLRSLPPTRPMDSVPLQPGLPQEEELALAAMGAPSFYNCLYFPQRMSTIFDREVLLGDTGAPTSQRWRECLRYYLGKLVVSNPGRRLLLKNPANSGRVGALRETFPGAKFIHIHRHPLEVFASTCKLYRRMLPIVALQPYGWEAVDRHILWAYPKLMDKLLDDLAGLPEGDVVEVRYDDLLRNPGEVVARIYRALGLGDVKPPREPLTQFATMGPSEAATKPALRAHDLERVAGRWRPQAERLGYSGLSGFDQTS